MFVDSMLLELLFGVDIDIKRLPSSHPSSPAPMPDHFKIASSWLQQFGKALQTPSIDETVSCIHPDGYLRDVLVFSWNNRCLHGHRKITAYLTNAEALKKSSIANVQLDTRPGLTSEYGRLTDKLPLTAVSAGFTFTCALGFGDGYFSLISTDSGEWKALVVMMALADIKGHEEMGHEEGDYGGHTLAWSDVNNERRKAIETNPDVVIIGAGQTGLNAAARFKQMNISALVVETNPRVGDNWRKRYPTLSLHSPRRINSMLYQSYPSTWPVFTPRDKMADWLEQYVQSLDLVVWTNSRPVPQPVYDSATKRWTVVIDRAGDLVTLHPAHIVVAAGALGAPRIPVIRDKALFSGTTLHSSEYDGGKYFAGQRVVVVGAGNTAADLCQDLTFHGAKSVTMVQRSGTWVVSRSASRVLMERMYPEELPVDVCDIMSMARPLALMKRLNKKSEAQMLEQEKETHRGLREAGLNISSGKDFFVLFYEGHGGFWLDVGCAELIRTGKVKIKQGAEIGSFTEKAVVFTDGSSLEADAVIFATSYEGICGSMRGVFGDAAIDRVGPVYGLDEEGELRGCYRPTGHPGLWFAAGDFSPSRISSKQLALEIKAIELGLLKL
ncbi:FAD/NAD-P-binding domain-containing protein [Mycena maculata]|uniref:FAD/NAD-P-binding domain-containing protein n=1 Tax=Mycena maculata TaxID=230809 RepID=A0AAD7NWF0_9AGAR|nr:FAD/NAD-P-binding domain-containing protein [Mycena maculata]